jgi:hypothetical protein
MPFGEVVGTTECMTLYPRCRANRGRYNQVQLNADNGSLVMYEYDCTYCFRISEGPRRLRWEVFIQCVWDVTDFVQAQRDNYVKLSDIKKCGHVNWARMRTVASSSE